MGGSEEGSRGLCFGAQVVHLILEGVWPPFPTTQPLCNHTAQPPS